MRLWIQRLLVICACATGPCFGQEQAEGAEHERMLAFCEGVVTQTQKHAASCDALGEALQAHIEAHRSILDWADEHREELSEDAAWTQVQGRCVEGFMGIDTACWENDTVRVAMASLASSDSAEGEDVVEIAPERQVVFASLTLFCSEMRAVASEQANQCEPLSAAFRELTGRYPDVVLFLQDNGIDQVPETEGPGWMNSIEPCVLGLFEISMGSCKEDDEVLKALDGLGALEF